MPLVTANQFQLMPDLVGSFGEGVGIASDIQRVTQFAENRDRDSQVRESLAASQVGGEEGAANLEKFQQQFPEEAQQFESKQLALQSQRFNAQSDREKQNTIQNLKDSVQLQGLNTPEEKIAQLDRNMVRNAKAKLSDPAVTNKDSQFLIDLYRTDPVAADRFVDAGIQVGDRLGLLKPVDKSFDKAQIKAKGDIQKQVNILRKDVTNATKTLNVINDASKKIKKVGTKGTAASDMALVFSFMKILDPGSTVREGEFASAQNAAGIDERVVNAYNNALKGTLLNPNQRKDFLNQAESLAEGQREATDQQIEYILQQADQDGIDRVRVFGKDRLSKFEERKSGRLSPEEKEELARLEALEAGK